MPDTDPAALLAPIQERHALAVMPDPDPVFFGPLFQIKSHLVRTDIPRLLAAVEAALDQADDLTRKSEALDAEAEYIAGEHPEAAAVAVLKRERSIAYDECARWFRAAITTALTEGEGGNG